MVYAASLSSYRNAGWPGVLPVPHEKKFPPPTGFTGDDGAWPDLPTYSNWVTAYAGHDIALRMPDDVIGIDVDHYLKGTELKEGAEQLDLITARCGSLPPTWSSTARGTEAGPGPSRTLFFRKRGGTKFPGNVAADIDILQRHHRYCVVAPSVHTTTGTPYRWYRPDGSPAADGEVPRVEDLPVLPRAWADYLMNPDPALAGRRTGTGYRGSHGVRGHDDTLAALVFNWALQGLDDAEIRELWAQSAAEHTVDPAWPYNEGDFARHMRQVREKTDAIKEELRQELLGWPRLFGQVSEADCQAWLEEKFADPELATVEASEEQEEAGTYIPVAMAADPGPLAYVAERLPRNEWGYPTFDPQGSADQLLAEQVLAAFRPSIRFAEDAQTWVERRRDKWVTRTKGTPGWMVANAVHFMPPGKKGEGKPEDMTPYDAAQDERYKRRVAFMDAGKSGSVGSKISTLVLSSHPCTCRLDEMDTDSEVLWGGGVPWDLRRSGRGPVRAAVSDDTPHMRTAGYTPGNASADTPLWDAITAAVWPDPELRHWALRVLAITLTGKSTADIPLLVGAAGRGKSAVSELLLDLLGEYGHKAPRELLDPQHKDPHAEYELKGRRLALIDEAPQPGRNRQAKLKDLTGGTRRQGRQLYKDFVQFTPTHTLMMTANRGEDDPVMSDEAIKRRVRLIPCEGDKAAVDEAMDGIGYAPFTPAWQGEAPHVLAKMMAQAAAYLADPRWHLAHVPTASSLLEDAIKHDQNTVLQWVLAETEFCDPGTPANELHLSYSQWCKDHGEFAEKLNGRFGSLLKDALGGVEPRMNSAGRKVYPVRVRTPGLPSVQQWMGAPDYGRPVDNFPESTETRGGSQTPARDPSEGVSVPTWPGKTTYSPETQRPTLLKKNVEVEEVVGGVPEKLSKNGVSVSGSLASGNTGTPQTGSLYPEPVVPNKTSGPETGENTQNGQNRTSPPEPKKPRSKLTPEERLERETARKARLAQARAEEKKAKVAGLGGRLVTLPAVVLRDGAIMEVSADTSWQWLEGCLGELGVDVEHSGYPRMHKDYALRLVQLGNEGSAVVFDPADPDQAEVIRWALSEATVLHAHSALADLIPLEAAGLCDASAWDRMRDTVVMAKLTDPSLCDSDEGGLKALARALLGDEYALSWSAEKLKNEIFAAGGWLTECEVTTPVERSGWANIPVNEAFVRYAAADVMDCCAISRVLQEVM